MEAFEGPLLLEVNGSIATISLNRPKFGNSLSPELLLEMKRIFNDLKSNLLVRVIVLTAVGKYFCTGMDLSSSNQKKMGLIDAKTSIEIFELLYAYPKPIIARINGPALAGGWGILFCTDIRIATKSSWFSFAEVRRGIVPALISTYVVPQLGPFNSKQLFLTGERISAERAKEIGFLSEVAESEIELDLLTKKYVDMLLAGGPNAMKIIKQAVNHHVGNIHDKIRDYSMELFDSGLVTRSEEALFGIKMFIQDPSKPVAWDDLYANQEQKSKL